MICVTGSQSVAVSEPRCTFEVSSTSMVGEAEAKARVAASATNIFFFGVENPATR